MKRKSGYDVSITFLAQTFDRDRIEQVVRHQFGAEDIAIRIEIHRDETRGGPRRPPQWEPAPGTGAAALLQLIRERRIVRSREFKDIPNVRQGLALLLMDGHVEKVRHGVYKLGGAVIAKDEGVGRSHALGPRQKAILDALAEPRTASELRRSSGTSRQAVDQLLKKLIRDGLIRRLPTTVESSDWLYVQAGQRDLEAAVARIPSLADREITVINLLPPTIGVRQTELIAHLGQGIRPAIRRLEAKGLIETVGTQKHRIIRLTRKGLRHPSYSEDGHHLTPADEATAFRPAMVELMMALDTLKQARAIDLTDLSGVEPKGKVGTGQYLQRLRAGGYVERLPGEGRPVYRLTKAGVAAISSTKARTRALGDEETKARIEAARLARTTTTVRKLAASASSHMRQSRTPELLSIISSVSGVSASEINARLSRPYKDRRSVHVALKSFEEAGRIIRQGREDGLLGWAITKKGAALLDDLTGPSCRSG